MFRAVGHRHGLRGLLPVAARLRGQRRHLPRGPGASPAAREPILCPDRPEARRGALITVLVLFAVLLCASTAAISAVTAPLAARSGAEAPRADPIAGSAALRPDLLEQARWPFTDTPDSAAHESVPSAASSPPTSSQPTSSPPVSPPPTSSPPPDALVRRFTTDLATDPTLAVAQLAPELSGDRAGLARAWEPAEQVRTREIRPLGPDSATAEITALFPGGKRIAMREEFRTAGDRISAVRLLGASVQH